MLFFRGKSLKTIFFPIKLQFHSKIFTTARFYIGGDPKLIFVAKKIEFGKQTNYTKQNSFFVVLQHFLGSK